MLFLIFGGELAAGALFSIGAIGMSAAALERGDTNSCSSIHGIYYTNFHSSVLRWEQIQTGSVESWTLEHAHRRSCVWLRAADVTNPLLPNR